MRMVLARLASVSLLLAFASAVSAQPAPFEWPRATPDQARIDPAMPEALKASLANNRRLLTFGLVRDGKLIIEHYQGEAQPDSYVGIASVTKSITAILVGIALDKGVLKSVDQPLTDFFPELDAPDVDPKSRTITLAHLLSLSAGWAVSPSDEPPENPLDALKRQVTLTPGETFQYDNASSHLIAIALARAIGGPLETFAEKHLFEPLGIKGYLWGRDNQGRVLGWHRMQFTLRDTLKFGQLVLDKGEWQGRRVVSAGWIEAMLTRRNAGGPYTNMPYGYQWYLFRTPDRKHEAVMGIGYGGQFLYVVPELRTAVVITHVRDQRSADMAFMREIVMPAIRP
ncbi:MAG: serine hydrolase [Rhizobiales bacterium]|nr:serine hydrolase [Hyphomicrobiales bacterium]